MRAGAATCASTTPIRPRKTVEYVDSIMADVRWLGFDWGAHLYYASDYFEQLYEWAVQLIRAGKAYVDDQSAEEIRAHPRHAHRAGPREPVAGSVRRGEPRSLRADAGGGVPRRLARAAREDRHGLAEPQPARSHDVPDPQGGASPDGRRVVHLPDVRLRPRPVGLDREASRTRSARWSTRTTGRCTTGSSTSSASITRSRSSSRGSTSATPC